MAPSLRFGFRFPNHVLGVTLLVALVTLAGTAHASFVPIGIPLEGNSWYQEWESGTNYRFNEFQFMIVENGPFADEPLQDFSEDDWAIFEISDDWMAVIARGGEIDGTQGETLSFISHFEGELEDGIEMWWVTYDHGERQRSGGLFWNGQTWTALSRDWNPGSQWQEVIPEPATILLSGLGLAMMGGAAYRRRKNR